MFKYVLNFKNGEQKQMQENTLQNAPFEALDSIDFLLCENIPAGTEGYYLLPGHRQILKNAAIGLFKERPDTEFELYEPFLPLIGVKCESCASLYVATGLSEQVAPVVKIKNNRYSFYLRFKLDGEIPFEIPKVKTYTLTGKDANYSGMARAYRNYLLQNGFISIKERLNKELKYAAEAMCIRVRLGWKPVPCTILEQTVENEPPMHVACTFADVEELMHAYKNAGIEKAEFCLVGWNVKGHDGRWPQALPVEAALGGEEGLKKLVKTAQSLGYRLTCHTNSTDAYSIADNFSFDDIALLKNREKSVEAVRWSGGKSYNLCPKRAYEISSEVLSEVAELGFKGLHYIDVITCTPPRRCYHEKHPVNPKEAGVYFDRLFALTQKLFGGSACEGPFVFSLKNIDFVLYASFYNMQNAVPDIADTYIPFWQLVFHGIILSNPFSVTINATLSDNPDYLLKLIEYGGRPVVYYYSQFVSDNTNWIGDTDFTIDTPESFEKGVQAAAKMDEIYKNLSFLQYEFMESHEEIAPNVYRTTYSDGSVITVDYNEKTYKLETKKQ